MTDQAPLSFEERFLIGCKLLNIDEIHSYVALGILSSGRPLSTDSLRLINFATRGLVGHIISEALGFSDAAVLEAASKGVLAMEDVRSWVEYWLHWVEIVAEMEGIR